MLTKLKLVPHGNGYIWTNEEKGLIRSLYTGKKESIKSIQYFIKEKFGIERTYYSIQHMIGVIGLSRHKKVKWSEKDIETLENLAGKFTAVEIAHKLHRSRLSVCHKANSL
jgi:hypothetical protein